MAHNARVEELSDSDPEEMDISTFDPATAQATLIEPSSIPTSGGSGPSPMQLQPQIRSQQTADLERSKNWQCLYPVYFDAARTRAEGRRVGSELAVKNPLAREIVDAVASLGLKVTFEPGKMHPKDWSNPGRVRVLLKENGQTSVKNIKNKHHLYIFVAAFLRSHPANEKTPMRLQIQGMPTKEPLPPPAIPKGWKMNTILPLHSPAVTGGGVKDNFFKDMMAEMQGEAGGSASGGEGKKKKDKRKK